MTDPKEKKPTIKTRPPGRLGGGMFDRVKLPTQGPHPIEEIIAGHPTAEPTPPRDSTPSRDTRVSTPARRTRVSTPSTGSHTSEPLSAAPERDFTRVANSIVRDALSGGAFGGKSKQLYDFLYAQTRGAVVPRRSVTLSKVKLMAGADIGSEVTLKKNLDRLKAAGLVQERVIAGVHGGNEFTICLPEEAAPRVSTPSTPSTDPSSLSKVETVESVESSPSSPSLIVETQSTSGDAKTSFKTNIENDDDEAFAGMLRLLRQAAAEVTGKRTTAAECDRWSEVAELLVTELKIAAARTTVSSAPAFLAEHLRRRLRKADSRQIEREVSEATAGAASISGATVKQELTHEQIEEQAGLLTGLMQGGASMAELEEQFAGNFRPAQWHMIRSIALARRGLGQPAAPAPTD